MVAAARVRFLLTSQIHAWCPTGRDIHRARGGTRTFGGQVLSLAGGTRRAVLFAGDKTYPARARTRSPRLAPGAEASMGIMLINHRDSHGGPTALRPTVRVDKGAYVYVCMDARTSKYMLLGRTPPPISRTSVVELA